MGRLPEEIDIKRELNNNIVENAVHIDNIVNAASSSTNRYTLLRWETFYS